jgi:hypothetical protein
MRLLSLLLILNGCAAAADAQRMVTYAGKRFHYQLVIDSTLSADSVNFDCRVKAITVFASSGQLVQTIRPEENSCFCDLPTDQLFIVEDVNFDGQEDLRLLQFVPAAPNLPYYFWTYSPATHRFVRERSLEDITSPDFDPVHRLITSFWRSGCCDHGLDVYRWVQGKPVLVEASEVKRDAVDESKIITTLRKRVGGKMILVKRTVEVDKGGGQQ